MSQLFLKTKTVGYYMVEREPGSLFATVLECGMGQDEHTLTAGQTDPSAGN
jgi:hypothetical protein